MRTVNWHAASNHEFPIPGMQFEAMKRGDRRAIGEGGGCWNIYLHLSIFLPTRGIFFFYRDPWVPPDTSVCIVFTRIIWYIGLFLFSLSPSHWRMMARFVINVEITAREFQRGIGCHLVDRESTMNRSNLLFSREKRNRWMFQSGIRE